MNLFRWLGSLFDDADSVCASLDTCESMCLMDDDVSNPANGLPMIGGFAGVDIEGNLYGTDLSHDTYTENSNHWGGASGFDGD